MCDRRSTHQGTDSSFDPIHDGVKVSKPVLESSVENGSCQNDSASDHGDEDQSPITLRMRQLRGALENENEARHYVAQLLKSFAALMSHNIYIVAKRTGPQPHRKQRQSGPAAATRFKAS